MLDTLLSAPLEDVELNMLEARLCESLVEDGWNRLIRLDCPPP